jgi:hypothetical protein
MGVLVNKRLLLWVVTALMLATMLAMSTTTWAAPKGIQEDKRVFYYCGVTPGNEHLYTDPYDPTVYNLPKGQAYKGLRDGVYYGCAPQNGSIFPAP